VITHQNKALVVGVSQGFRSYALITA